MRVWFGLAQLIFFGFIDRFFEAIYCWAICLNSNQLSDWSFDLLPTGHLIFILFYFRPPPLRERTPRHQVATSEARARAWGSHGVVPGEGFGREGRRARGRSGRRREGRAPRAVGRGLLAEQRRRTPLRIDSGL